MFIKTDKLSKNIYHAVNTLTQRMPFPGCTGEVTLDASGLNDGDSAGLAAFQGNYVWVGVRKEEGKLYAVMCSYTNNSGDVWQLGKESGVIEEKLELGTDEVRLRLTAVFEDGDGTIDTAFCEVDRGITLRAAVLVFLFIPKKRLVEKQVLRTLFLPLHHSFNFIHFFVCSFNDVIY